MTGGRARIALDALKDLGTAVLVLVLLGAFGTAAESGPVDRGLDARVAALIAEYGAVDGELLRHPSVVIANFDGPAVASSNCSEWRISVRTGAAASLSDTALDELLAHELAHLVECAETGQSSGHGASWWLRYHALVDLT